MILVDTSVLINFFRGRKTAGTSYLEKLINEEQSFCITEFVGYGKRIGACYLLTVRSIDSCNP